MGMLKKAFKVVMIGGVALVGVGIAVAALSDSETPKTTKTEGKKTPAERQNEETSSASLTELYEKIKTGDTITGEGGMTIDEVKALLGEPDTNSESETAGIGGKAVKMNVMTWTKLSSSGVQSVSVTFINGKASQKTMLK